MTSIIDRNSYLEYISIKHLGTIDNGVEDTDSPDAASWALSFEN